MPRIQFHRESGALSGVDLGLFRSNTHQPETSPEEANRRARSIWDKYGRGELEVQKGPLSKFDSYYMFLEVKHLGYPIQQRAHFSFETVTGDMTSFWIPETPKGLFSPNPMLTYSKAELAGVKWLKKHRPGYDYAPNSQFVKMIGYAPRWDNLSGLVSTTGPIWKPHLPIEELLRAGEDEVWLVTDVKIRFRQFGAPRYEKFIGLLVESHTGRILGSREEQDVYKGPFPAARQ